LIPSALCMVNLRPATDAGPLFLAIQSLIRSSFGHALAGKSQDSLTMPRPGTNPHDPADGACEFTGPA